MISILDFAGSALAKLFHILKNLVNLPGDPPLGRCIFQLPLPVQN